MQPEQQQIRWRMNAIIGHLEAVVRMVEEDRSGEQLISQVQAIRGAVDSVLTLLVQNSVQDSLEALNCKTCLAEKEIEIHRLVRMYQSIRK